MSMATGRKEGWIALAALVAPPLLFAAYSRIERSLLGTSQGWWLFGIAFAFIAVCWLSISHLLRRMKRLDVWRLLFTATAIGSGPFWGEWLDMPPNVHAPSAVLWMLYLVFASAAAIVPVALLAFGTAQRRPPGRANEEL